MVKGMWHVMCSSLTSNTPISCSIQGNPTAPFQTASKFFVALLWMDTRKFTPQTFNTLTKHACFNAIYQDSIIPNGTNHPFLSGKDVCEEQLGTGFANTFPVG